MSSHGAKPEWSRAALLRRFALVGLILIHLVACTSMQTVRIPDQDVAYLNPPISVGNSVEVVELNGTRHSFEVTRVTDLGLGGDPGFIAYEDMASLKKQVHNESTGQWIGAIVALAVLAVLIGNSESVCVNCTPPEPQ